MNKDAFQSFEASCNDEDDHNNRNSSITHTTFPSSSQKNDTSNNQTNISKDDANEANDDDNEDDKPLPTSEVCRIIRQNLQNMEKSLRCPLCLSCYHDEAVMIGNCCHTYCRPCIVRALQIKRECPTCKEPCTKRSLVAAPQLDTLVRGFKHMLRDFGLAPSRYDPTVAITQLLPEDEEIEEENKGEQVPSPLPPNDTTTSSTTTPPKRNSLDWRHVHEHVQVARTFARYLTSSRSKHLNTTEVSVQDALSKEQAAVVSVNERFLVQAAVARQQEKQAREQVHLSQQNRELALEQQAADALMMSQEEEEEEDGKPAARSSQSQEFYSARETVAPELGFVDLSTVQDIESLVEKKNKDSKETPKHENTGSLLPKNDESNSLETFPDDSGPCQEPVNNLHSVVASASTSAAVEDSDDETVDPLEEETRQEMQETEQKAHPEKKTTFVASHIETLDISTCHEDNSPINQQSPDSGENDRLPVESFVESSGAAKCTKNSKLAMAMAYSQRTMDAATVLGLLGQVDASFEEGGVDHEVVDRPLDSKPSAVEPKNQEKHKEDDRQAVENLNNETRSDQHLQSKKVAKEQAAPSDRELYLPQSPRLHENSPSRAIARMPDYFSVGSFVEVESRTWPGVNKQGGVGKVLKVHHGGGKDSVGEDTSSSSISYDIAYVLGGKENKVDAIFVSSYDMEKSEGNKACGSVRQRLNNGIPRDVLLRLESEGFDTIGRPNLAMFRNQKTGGATSSAKENTKPPPSGRQNRKRLSEEGAEESGPKRQRLKKSASLGSSMRNMLSKKRSRSDKHSKETLPALSDSERCEYANELYADQFRAALQKGVVNIAASSLPKETVEQVFALCGLTKSSSVKAKATEVVGKKTSVCVVSAHVTTPPNKTANSRTLKTMRAALAGIPIVDSSWIADCLKAGKVLEPSPRLFVRTLPSKVEGNITDYGVAHLAALIRLGSKYKPLSGCAVFLCGKCSRKVENDISVLTREAGGTVVTQMQSLLAKIRSESMVVLLCNKSTSDDSSLPKALESEIKQNPRNVVCVTAQWLFDSVSSGKVQHAQAYPPEGKKMSALWKITSVEFSNYGYFGTSSL